MESSQRPLIVGVGWLRVPRFVRACRLCAAVAVPADAASLLSWAELSRPAVWLLDVFGPQDSSAESQRSDNHTTRGLDRLWIAGAAARPTRSLIMMRSHSGVHSANAG